MIRFTRPLHTFPSYVIYIELFLENEIIEIKTLIKNSDQLLSLFFFYFHSFNVDIMKFSKPSIEPYYKKTLNIQYLETVMSDDLLFS